MALICQNIHHQEKLPVRGYLAILNRCIWCVVLLLAITMFLPAYAQQPVELEERETPPTIINKQVPETVTQPQTENQTETAETREKKKFVPDPAKSWKYSAILPGLGQAYNRSYWKIPIIYAGLGAVVFVYNFNHTNYHKWRDAYIAKVDPNIPDEYPEASEHQIKNLMNSYRRDREYTILAGFVLYVFNILEAYVHAHLLNFDVGEDLSLKIEPNIQPFKGTGGLASNTYGLKLTLNF